MTKHFSKHKFLKMTCKNLRKPVAIKTISRENFEK